MFNSLKKKYAENKKITALTAYDYSTAKILDEVEIDLILVGDSLAMTFLGHKTTHKVTMNEMIIFTQAVGRGVKNTPIVGDMPFMSYQNCPKTALENAGRFIKETDATAVKMEGAAEGILKTIKKTVDAGIPVMGHIGFTPQFLYSIGGYKVQGKTEEAEQEMLAQAKELENAGVFALVLEMTPEKVAKKITEQLNIPTLGIGAGRYTSGQILVTDDIIGNYPDFTPKFARKYADVYSIKKQAIQNYIGDVNNSAFPAEGEIFS